jgi:hypothetical protein
MLLSTLRVASATLDVDRVLAAHPDLAPDAVWHVGDRRPPGRTATTNGFNVCIVEDEQTWAAVVERTLSSLERLQPLLAEVQRLGVEPEVDFGVSVGTDEVFVRSCRLRAEDLRRFVALGVAVCVTAYPSSDEGEALH